MSSTSPRRGRDQRTVATAAEVRSVVAPQVVMAFADVARTVLAAPPRLGSVRVVAVDGFAGSGKSTFAARLAAALGAQVLHTDDLLEGWADIVSFWPRLERWVLAPLRAGTVGRYRRYDWESAAFAEWHDVPTADAMVVEGVTSARAQVRPELTLSVWVEAPAEVRLARGIARDGEALRPQWERWMVDEAAHAAADCTPDHVDIVVDGEPMIAHDPEREFVRWVESPQSP